MTYRLATQKEVVEVCRKLRQEDIDEAFALYGVHPGLFLPLHWKWDETWVLLGKDGRPFGLAGSYPTKNPLTGQAWMVSTPALEENKVEFLRGSRSFIEKLHEKYPVLHNYVDARQEQHLRWLSWLGFTAILKPQWGLYGLPFFEVIRIKRCVSLRWEPPVPQQGLWGASEASYK